MTDAQMMLLEQLTYLGGRNDNKNSVGAIINSISQEELDAMLRGDRIMDNGVIRDVGNERERQIAADRARAYNAIKNDSELMELEIIARDTYKGTYAFAKEGDDRCYVAFQGTTDGYEWVDNFYTLHETDTLDQKYALDFIENIPQEYQHISVTGHSKGGNKAMYVTICSDRVDNCVAMDGPGFNQEFLQKYREEIFEKGGLIRNYSLDSDFVNILLSQIPGSHQIFIPNNGKYIGAENHEPTSLLMYDSDGVPFVPAEGAYSRQELYTYLHEFTQFADQYLDYDDKVLVAGYLGPMLALLRDKDYSIEINGVVYTKSNLKDYLLQDPKALGIILAMLTSYMKINKIGAESIFQALTTLFGMDEASAKIIVTGFGIISVMNTAKKGVLGFLDKWIEENVLDVIEGFFIRELIRCRKKIAEFASRVGNALGLGPDVYNYSDKALEALEQTIRSLNSSYSIHTSWDEYSSQKWYQESMVSSLVRGINLYFNTFVNVNNNSLFQIQHIFENARNADSECAAKIRSKVESIQNSFGG